ncbi:hypothetical protein EUX98_g7105 [Antrodiella citrinella]|uniref:RRM domain-containing protein n=1 Tax=Antrodiella citrinella TaxID=2447956 RepID=A0A4S4MN72_9APHY|nr:hypothetical protein EUX98_g7105 [Antrodiella citrinella]
MAASSIVDGNVPPQENWEQQQHQDIKMHASDDPPPTNGGAPSAEDHRGDDTNHTIKAEEGTPGVDGTDSNSGKQADGTARGEKLIKPNKVYIGGLPEHTRKEDLENCFGKIGNVVNIELKVGYGFVEFDTKEAAEESVAKYHDGYFMGNKIRVELSRGGGRTAKYGGDPGACFKCGQVGHWARDARYYDYPPPPSRDYRRPPSPARDYRDYPVRSSRELEDYRSRGVAPPPARYESRPGYYPPEGEPVPAAGYPPRVFAPPPARDYYDRYDRRAPPPAADRYGYPPAAASGRPRSPPGAPPRGREEYDRPPPRDYPPPPAEYRGRPASPPPGRSQSPPPRSASYEAGYPPNTGGPGYTGPAGYSAGYAANGSSARGSAAARDYPPPPRSREGDPPSAYRRT